MSVPNLRSNTSLELKHSKEFMPLKDGNGTSYGKLKKGKSCESLLSINVQEKLLNSKRMPANPIIVNMMRQDRMSALENGNSAITKVSDLSRSNDPQYRSSVTLSREKSLKKKSRANDIEYGNLVTRVKSTFLNEEPELQTPIEPPEDTGFLRKLSKKLSKKVHPEPQVPPERKQECEKAKPLPGPDKVDLLTFQSESDFHVALKKFNYEMELDALILEESENELFEQDINALAVSDSLNDIPDAEMPPELQNTFGSLFFTKKSDEEDHQTPEFFARMRSQIAARKTTYIKPNKVPTQETEKSSYIPVQLPPKEMTSFAWAFASGINSSNWGQYISQWKKKGSMMAKQPKPNTTNVTVPDGPKEFIDPAIVYAEKQMSAWEQMKEEMFTRTGYARNKFQSFVDVIWVVRGLKQLGMNPNLLNRVDKSTLSIVIKIKLWKKRALENKYSRNEPVRRLVATVDRSLALEIPPSIHHSIIKDCIDIVSKFEKKYQGVLGQSHSKTIHTRKQIEILKSMIPNCPALPQRTQGVSKSGRIYPEETLDISVPSLNDDVDPFVIQMEPSFPAPTPKALAPLRRHQPPPNPFMEGIEEES